MINAPGRADERMEELPVYRSKLVTTVYDVTVNDPIPQPMVRDMQLERAHIVGVRFITFAQLQKSTSPVPGRTVTMPTLADTALIMVEFLDRFHDVVYDRGPVRPFVIPSSTIKPGTRRELYRPVSWRGVDLRSSTMVINLDPFEVETVSICWEFTFIERGEFQG